MTSLGMILLVASATTGFDGKAHAGGLHFFRHAAVANGPAPAGGPMMPGGMGPGGPEMGPGGPGGPGGGRRFANVRSQVVFFGPGGPGGVGDVKIGWQTAGANGEKIYLPGRATPFRYNFMQGYIYRLKMSDISGRPNLSLYPTIEVAPSTPQTDAYLTHNQIPIQFTAEDLDQVEGGNFVTKVIYLPDPRFQELAVANVETLVSTRLEPGIDPVLEADKRGTILMIVRLGGINLEMDPVGVPVPSDGPSVMMAPAGPTTTMPPGMFPAGVATPPVISTPMVPVDAPVSSMPLEAPANPSITPPVPVPRRTERTRSPRAGSDSGSGPRLAELIAVIASTRLDPTGRAGFSPRFDLMSSRPWNHDHFWIESKRIHGLASREPRSRQRSCSKG